MPRGNFASKLSLLLYQVWSFDVILWTFAAKRASSDYKNFITKFDHGLQTEINHNFNTNVEQDINCCVLVGYIYVTTIVFC